MASDKGMSGKWVVRKSGVSGKRLSGKWARISHITFCLIICLLLLSNLSQYFWYQISLLTIYLGNIFLSKVGFLSKKGLNIQK